MGYDQHGGIIIKGNEGEQAIPNRKSTPSFRQFSRAAEGRRQLSTKHLRLSFPNIPPHQHHHGTTTTFVNLSERYGVIVVGKVCCWNSSAIPPIYPYLIA